MVVRTRSRARKVLIIIALLLVLWLVACWARAGRSGAECARLAAVASRPRRREATATQPAVAPCSGPRHIQEARHGGPGEVLRGRGHAAGVQRHRAPDAQGCSHPTSRKDESSRKFWEATLDLGAALRTRFRMTSITALARSAARCPRPRSRRICLHIGAPCVLASHRRSHQIGRPHSRTEFLLQKSGALAPRSSRTRPISWARCAASRSPSWAETIDPFMRMCHRRANASESSIPAWCASVARNSRIAARCSTSGMSYPGSCGRRPPGGR